MGVLFVAIVTPDAVLTVSPAIVQDIGKVTGMGSGLSGGPFTID